MKKATMQCFDHSGNKGCSHELTAEVGEGFHTEINGVPYILRLRTDAIVELIPQGPIHVGTLEDFHG